MCRARFGAWRDSAAGHERGRPLHHHCYARQRPLWDRLVTRTAARLPDFVVVGAAKAGTTALHHYLGQHPAIFVPQRQEPSFFAFAGDSPRFRGPGGSQASINRTAVTGLTEYGHLYERARQCQVLGDVSPVYLYWPSTAGTLRQCVPRIRIIVILRHPVDRAFSAYMHAQREGKEPIADFREALAAEPERIAQDWGFLWRYAALGDYLPQLRRYFDRFSSEQIKVVLYEDLQDDPVALCRQLQAFVGVDASLVPDVSVRYNVSGVPRSRGVHRLLRPGGVLGRSARRAAPLIGKERLQRWGIQLQTHNLERRRLDSAVRSALLPRFCSQVAELGQLIGRDLSHWLDREGMN